MTNKENTSLSDKIIESKLAMKYRDICVKDVKASIRELKEDLYKAITKRKWDAINTHLLDIIIEDIFGKELSE